MKFLFDLFPIILFFVAYHWGDIYLATAVAVAASVLQIAVYWLWQRRVERMHLISGGLIVVFGAMTLALANPLFIMWKPTIVNFLFAAVFIASGYIGKRTIVEHLMRHVIEVPTAVYRRVNWAWAWFFVFSGVLNIIVAYGFSEAFWVNFKLFGLMGLTFVFMIGQGIYLGAAGAKATAQSEPENQHRKNQSGD